MPPKAIARAESLVRGPHRRIGFLLDSQRSTDLVHDVLVGCGDAAADRLFTRGVCRLPIGVDVTARESRARLRVSRSSQMMPSLIAPCPIQNKLEQVSGPQAHPAASFMIVTSVASTSSATPVSSGFGKRLIIAVGLIVASFDIPASS